MANTSRMGGSLTVTPRGERLAALRTALKMTQNEVEQETGLPPGRLTQYENSKPIPIDYLDLLINFYGVSAREVCNPDSMATVLGIATRIATVFEGQLIFNQQARLAQDPIPAGLEPAQ